MTITAELIGELAAQLHGLELTPARCAELAGDVERHITALRNAAQQLDFNDEPARFAALLAAYAERGEKRR